jgi:hypothetical protein
MILGIIGIVIGRKKYLEGLEVSCWFITIILAIVLIISLSTEYPTKTRVDYDIAMYNELKLEVQQLSTIGGNNCELNLLAKGELFNEVRKMNYYIEENKIKSKSPWVGIFYSEEVGKLEKIELK